MTVDEIIARVDALEPNQYKRETKISWISDLDEMIFHELYETHEMPSTYPTTFTEYSTGNETVLVSGTYGNALYENYVMGKIAKDNFEIDKYNVEISLFNNAYAELCNFINRSYLPKFKGKLRF